MDRIKQLYKNTRDTVLTWDLRIITKRLLFLAVIVAVGASIFWYKDVYMTNERRFWLAIDNSMATPSVVRTLTTGGTGNQVVQDNRFIFGANSLTQSRVQFENISPTVRTTVVTEGLSTLESQFSRYVAFETNDKKADGSIPELDNLLGKWSGATSTDANAEDARLNYLSEIVSLAVFGNFDAEYRHEVLDSLRSAGAYDINELAISEDEIDGEAVLLYPVAVGLKAYVEQLQNSFVKSGLGEFPPLNPDNYRADSRVNAVFAIRKRDNVIVGIQFGDRREEYTNYGVLKDIELPTPVFTPQELESAVQAEIQG